VHPLCYRKLKDLPMSTKKSLRPAALAVAVLLAGLATASQAQEIRRPYIVQLVGAPAASYDGDVAGLPATKPAAGQRLDVSADNVQNYLNYLATKQADVIATIDPANVTAQYDVVLNGFAAMLTDTEVRALKKNSAVMKIEADAIQQPHTSYTPHFIGLDKPGGLWDQLGGQGHAGEDMIIGHLDSGVWPEDPSFADRVDAQGNPTRDPSASLAYGPAPAKWKGIGCELKAGIKATDCNNKLIGIRAYTPGTGLNAGEFPSGRDATVAGGGGHGSHTLSTAGGNASVAATLNGVDMGKLSGVAPRARVAMYKVCYTNTAGTGGCANSASVSAVNQAIKDGVDVINYSIGPTTGGGTLTDAVTVAFLNASNAGVFVTASAGNSGPATYPAANLGPWHATVAASTHDRTIGAATDLGNGAEYVGASVNQTEVPATALIRSTDAGLAGADPVKVNLCYSSADGGNVLDPAKVAGKIVVCTRGTTARVNKSLAVKEAGGVGMILADNGAGLVAEAHSVPTIHVNVADGQAVKAYAGAAGAAATATVGKAVTRFGAVIAPQVAGFSSRGPNVANNNLLKPDFAAPGVDIMAAYTADISTADRNAIAAGGSTTATGSNSISGTSMASPHIAGMAALLKQAHPSWTPAMIKSALMTTAVDTYDDGSNSPLAWSATATSNGRLPWAQGAGQAQPSSAFDPGLVYNATAIDYARLSCGLGLGLYSAATCNAIGSISAQNLNLPSLTSGSVLGVQTLSRTVTNVGANTSTYTASASLPGFNVVVSPSTLTLDPGASASYSVTLTRTSTPLDTWAYGSLTWSDGTHNVRSPLTARGTALAVPAVVSSEAATGSKIFTIGTGFAGAMSADKSGLKAATRTTATLTGASTANATTLCRNNNASYVNVQSFAIPANTLAARFSLYNDDTTGGKIQGGQDDLDMVILDAANNVVGGSLNDGSNESVTLSRPAAGTYKVCTVAYNLQGRPSTTFTLSSWVVAKGEVGAGAFKVLLPGTAYVGGTASVGMSWSGLAAGIRYLGAASYNVLGVPQGLTLVEVNTNDPVPLAVNAKVVSPAD
jgi:subtilisin family serine protease